MSDPLVDLNRSSILLVDDEPSNIAVLEQVLEDCGYSNVHSTTDPYRAKALCEETAFDLILLDVKMPRLNGYDLCKIIKEHENGKNASVVFLTARNSTEDEVRGFSLGAVDFITKPFNIHRLAARIRTHLELTQAHHQLADQNTALLERDRLRREVEQMVRHDLRSPLNAIIGIPQFICMSDNLEDKQRELLKNVEDAGLEMLEMINMSHNVFKMERGRYELDPEPFDLRESLNKTTNTLFTLASSKSLRVELPDTETRCMAYGEPLLCYSLLTNLFKNAIEASPDVGAISITVQADDTMATIIMENDGEVPVEIRETFFEKYSTSGKKFGTGLGTYSARLFTEVQNGQIRLDASSPGKTRIVLSLPKASEPLP